MRFDESSVSEIHQKMAQRSIKCVMDGFQLEKPPDYVIEGLNINEEIANLEQQKLKKSEKEIKKIEKEIRAIQNSANEIVKVIFEFNTNLKKLIYMRNRMQTTKYLTTRHIWSGVLDFPITSSFIFGRVCKKKRHGGGDYYFAPFEKLKHELVDRLERLNESVPDLFPYKIIESNQFIEILSGIKSTDESIDILRSMPKIIKKNAITTPLVDKLNQHNELINIMKNIPHFGTIKTAVELYVSEIDVSTVFIPYRKVTYFNIDQFAYHPKKHSRAIYSLLKALEELNL